MVVANVMIVVRITTTIGIRVAIGSTTNSAHRTTGNPVLDARTATIRWTTLDEMEIRIGRTNGSGRTVVEAIVATTDRSEAVLVRM